MHSKYSFEHQDLSRFTPQPIDNQISKSRTCMSGPIIYWHMIKLEIKLHKNHTYTKTHEQCLERNGHLHPLPCLLLNFSFLIYTMHMGYLNSQFWQTLWDYLNLYHFYTSNIHHLKSMSYLVLFLQQQRHIHECILCIVYWMMCWQNTKHILHVRSEYVRTHTSIYIVVIL
jgi:hypothetical protein